MYLARYPRLLAAMAVPAIMIFAGGAATAAQDTSAFALYVAPAVPGISPATCIPLVGNTVCPQGVGNWAGYYATGGFTYAQTSFSVPSLNCATTADGYASHWAGLGGVGTGPAQSTSLESAGVAEQCSAGNPSYQAFWETYPDPETGVFSVNPGDDISDHITYDNTADAHHGQYHFALTDKTTGQGFSVWEACAAAQCSNASAEVISSAPSSAASTLNSGILPLADYGAANFELVSVINNNGKQGGLLSSNWGYFYQATQQSATTGDTLAAPDAIYGGKAFVNTWQHAS